MIRILDIGSSVELLLEDFVVGYSFSFSNNVFSNLGVRSVGGDDDGTLDPLNCSSESKRFNKASISET